VYSFVFHDTVVRAVLLLISYPAHVQNDWLLIS